LERGLANPTLDSLRKVSNALSTSLLRMTEDGPKQSPVVRYDQRRHMSFPPGHVRVEILTPSLTKKMVVFQVRATAEDGNLVVQPLSEPTEECLVVIAGRISICIAGQTSELNAGDSVYFQGRDLESIHAIGEDEASYISAITPPVF
jgi:mannose-6-phosphate isomerase-like protein (cupin superfamily)